MKISIIFRGVLATFLVAHFWFAGAYALIAIVIDNWRWFLDAQTPQLIVALGIAISGTSATMPSILSRWHRPRNVPKTVKHSRRL